ncbi:Transmembrane protein 50A [Trichinella pseudospiralis]
MTSCFENLNININFDFHEKRNSLVAIFAGILFFSGWWIIIDVAAAYPSNTADGFFHAYYTCGVFSTISMFMLSSVSNSQVIGETISDGILGTRGARLWLLLGFTLLSKMLITSGGASVCSCRICAFSPRLCFTNLDEVKKCGIDSTDAESLFFHGPINQLEEVLNCIFLFPSACAFFFRTFH